MNKRNKLDEETNEVNENRAALQKYKDDKKQAHKDMHSFV